MEEEFKVKVGPGGEIIISPEISSKLGLKPREKLLIKERYNYIILEKPKKLLGDKMVGLLKKGLKGVEWKDIEEERKDREW